MASTCPVISCKILLPHLLFRFLSSNLSEIWGISLRGVVTMGFKSGDVPWSLRDGVTYVLARSGWTPSYCLCATWLAGKYPPFELVCCGEWVSFRGWAAESCVTWEMMIHWWRLHKLNLEVGSDDGFWCCTAGREGGNYLRSMCSFHNFLYQRITSVLIKGICLFKHPQTQFFTLEPHTLDKFLHILNDPSPKINTSPEVRDHFKRKIVFQPAFFQGIC